MNIDRALNFPRTLLTNQRDVRNEFLREGYDGVSLVYSCGTFTDKGALHVRRTVVRQPNMRRSLSSCSTTTNADVSMSIPLLSTEHRISTSVQKLLLKSQFEAQSGKPPIQMLVPQRAPDMPRSSSLKDYLHFRAENSNCCSRRGAFNCAKKVPGWTPCVACFKRCFPDISELGCFLHSFLNFGER